MRIPLSTYRLQFNAGFGFASARKILPYLAELGISDLYASPIFKARKGSTHGYDVLDQNRINPELGTEEEFEAFLAGLQALSLGLVQDIVPNHMAYDHENAMLTDVLENGRNSDYFDFFDIDWEHPYDSMNGRVLAPFLGDFYGKCLEKGDISLRYGREGFSAGYFDLTFPLKMETYGRVLTLRIEELEEKLGSEHPDYIRFLGALYVLKSLPAVKNRTARYNQIKFVKAIVWELYSQNETIHEFVDQNIRIFNRNPDGPDPSSLLNELLSEQLFRLSFWKVATEEINYRRFFDINDLISLRTQNEKVFTRTHSFILDLAARGHVTGLRIDHVDGLYDPCEYLTRLRLAAGDIYITVEKILGSRENLPEDWPVQGTSGYDFLNYVNGLFCQKEHAREFNRLYGRVIGSAPDYREMLTEKKLLILEKRMAGDLDNLTLRLRRISSYDRFMSDITFHGLRRALVEIMAHFPVYRTYADRNGLREECAGYLRKALEEAGKSSPNLANEFQLIERFLLLEFEDYITEEEKEQWLTFVMRFQQATGPLMAKGFEDTFLYNYNRLISLNDVGGDPDRFGFTVKEFDEYIRRREQQWPHAMNTTATHDTKRGEDVRARINVLSEIPQEWDRTVRRWFRLNARHREKGAGRVIPEKNDEYFLYQTLLGAWVNEESELPEFGERIKDYMIKAIREAKVHTAWLKPDEGYENGIRGFIDRILSADPGNPFLTDFLPFQRKIAHYGRINSLAQTLIKIAAPGVPDFYQGDELWDLNLVDPDNRRPVDYSKRRSILRDIRKRERTDVSGLIRELLQTPEDGRVKLFLTAGGLGARTKMADLFQLGSYVPLTAAGERRANVMPFARVHEGTMAVAVVPRFTTGIVTEGGYPLGEETWGATTIHLPEKSPSLWKDVFTGAEVRRENEVPVAEVLNTFPVALLIGT